MELYTAALGVRQIQGSGQRGGNFRSLGCIQKCSQRTFNFGNSGQSQKCSTFLDLHSSSIAFGR